MRIRQEGHLWMHWMYNILFLHVAVTKTNLLEKLNSHSQIIYFVILQILTAVSLERVGIQLLSLHHALSLQGHLSYPAI